MAAIGIRRAGAVVGSNSWGDDTQGAYDLSAMEFDDLVRDADFLATGEGVLRLSRRRGGFAGRNLRRRRR